MPDGEAVVGAEELEPGDETAGGEAVVWGSLDATALSPVEPALEELEPSPELGVSAPLSACAPASVPALPSEDPPTVVPAADVVLADA